MAVGLTNILLVGGRLFVRAIATVGTTLFPLARRMVLSSLVLGYRVTKALRERFNLNPRSQHFSKKKLALHFSMVAMTLMISRGTLLASNQEAFASNNIKGSLLSQVMPASHDGLIEDSTPPAAPSAIEDVASADSEELALADLNQLFLEDLENSEEVVEDSGYTSAQDDSQGPGVQPLRKETVEYVVKDGDTVSSIAEEFQVSTSTVLWENKLTARTLIRAGQTLKILPISGISYVVKANDTLSKIAQVTHSDIAAIRSLNNIEDASLVRGATLIVPNGRPLASPAPVIVRSKNPSSTARLALPSNLNTSDIKGLIWPTTLRGINQFFRGRHTGIDVKGKTGNAIYATTDGVVALSGWNRGGYGQQVVLQHSNGMITRYAHMSKILVSPGEQVNKGQVIGLVGSTGRSTGPHLHFEILIGGRRMNPLKYL